MSVAHVAGWRIRTQILELYVLDDSSSRNAPIISSNVRNLSDVQRFSLLRAANKVCMKMVVEALLIAIYSTWVTS
jgi:hypothetical protein